MTLVSRDYLITRTCYKQSNAFLMRRRRRSAVSPWNVNGPPAKHHPAWNPQCTQWFRAEEFPLLCPKPKDMPRFSLGDSAVAAVAQVDRYESYLDICGTR